MSTAVAANTTINPAVTLHDVAAVAGVSYDTASRCMSSKASATSSTVKRVRNIAERLGYNGKVAKSEGGKRGGSQPKRNPANSLFVSREAETAAMLKLRAAGHTNAEIAHRCGITRQCVYKRIGTQPAELTDASMKLAGKTRKAKSKIKESYEQQQLINAYNAKVEVLNAEMAKVKQMASEIESMQKSAASAAKATGTPLLRLLPPANIN